MAYEFKFPDVGEGIHEGRIVEWLVKEGDTVKMDAPLVKVETDKAVVELPSPAAGTVLKIHFPADAIIHVGDVIISIGEAGEKATGGSKQAEGLRLKAEGGTGIAEAKPAASELRTPNSEPAQLETRNAKLETAAGSSQPAASSQQPEDRQQAAGNRPQAAFEAVSPQLPAASYQLPVAGGLRPPATPRTRALARKLGVDLATIQGTGKHNRITDEDVKQAAGGRQQATGSRQQAEGKPAATELRSTNSELFKLETRDSRRETSESITRVPATYLRKKIAEHMLASKRTSAHVTHVDEADVTELYALYKQAKEAYKEKHGFNLTILPYFMKALEATIQDHPLINAAYDEAAGEIVYHKHVHIGLAADTPEGLVVPVVKHTQAKSIVAMGAEVVDLAAKARERRLALDEMKGATITITNIGPLGGLFATPILNQPNLAILALGEIKDRPVVVDGAIVVRKMIYLSLTFDHRIIDGAEAARFVRDLARILAKPGLLLAGA